MPAEQGGNKISMIVFNQYKNGIPRHIYVRPGDFLALVVVGIIFANIKAEPGCVMVMDDIHFMNISYEED